MRRIPILPTLIVAAAVAVMIALGMWQLQRAVEKERLLAQHREAADLPPLDLDPLLERGSTELPPLAYRRVSVTCRARGLQPELRGGRSREGRSGYSYFVPCRPGAEGIAGRLLVNVGLSSLPDDRRRITLDGRVTGSLGAVQAQGPVRLVSDAPVPPLEPSAPPLVEEIPNNHLSYAVQWFFFALAAAVIYVLALRRRSVAGETAKP